MDLGVIAGVDLDAYQGVLENKAESNARSLVPEPAVPAAVLSIGCGFDDLSSMIAMRAAGCKLARGVTRHALQKGQ